MMADVHANPNPNPNPTQVADVGATGEIFFDEHGARQGYIVNVLGLKPSGVHRVSGCKFKHSWFNLVS